MNALRTLTTRQGAKAGAWSAGVLVAVLLVALVATLVHTWGFANALEAERAASCHREDVIRAEVRQSADTLRGLVILVVRNAPPVAEMTFVRREQHEALRAATADLAAASGRLSRLSCDAPPPTPEEEP